MSLHLSEMSTLLEQKILKTYSKLNIDEIGPSFIDWGWHCSRLWIK